MTMTDGAVPEWSLGDRLRKAREHAGLKQSELAQFIGIARSSVVSYESGRTVPSRPVVLSWSLATGVSAEWVLGFAPAFAWPWGQKSTLVTSGISRISRNSFKLAA